MLNLISFARPGSLISFPLFCRESVKGGGAGGFCPPCFFKGVFKNDFPTCRVSTWFWGTRVTQCWEHSPLNNVAPVQIPASTPYVSWGCCWFSSLLREVFLRVLRFSPLLKNSNSIWNARTNYRSTKVCKILLKVQCFRYMYPLQEG